VKLEQGWIEVESAGQPVRAYLARQAVDQPAPGVLVIQEVWGPDSHIRDVSERFAAAGYVALAVDLYSRGGRPEALAEPRIEEVKRFLDLVPQSAWMDPAKREAELAKLPAAEGRRIAETLAELFNPQRPTGRYLEDLGAAFDYLREQPYCDGRVGSVGFCLGGGLSALLACQQPDLACAVIFYGASPPAEELARASCPLLGLYGERDERINAGVPAFEEAANQLGRRLETHTFSGAGHAFFNDTRASFEPTAARSAWALTLSFLDAHTSPAKEVAKR